jgi:hypothetical protein
MPKSSKSNVRLIRTEPVATGASPPASLSAVGRSLWTDIVSAYEFGDRASYEVLAQACIAADRAEACRVRIDKDGELLRTQLGVKEHPLLKHELQLRAFVCRSLQRLGLDLEPIRAPGRPSGWA